MAAEQNVESAKKAYAAFIAGDAEGAMANMADDIEWVTPGNSAISGNPARQAGRRAALGKARWKGV